jgi:hypothetical protein
MFPKFLSSRDLSKREEKKRRNNKPEEANVIIQTALDKRLILMTLLVSGMSITYCMNLPTVVNLDL